MNKNQFDRYRIIDFALRAGKCVKTRDLCEMIAEETGLKVSKRTIQQDLKAMKESPELAYYAPIEYEQKLKAYFYADPSYTINNIAGISEGEVEQLYVSIRYLQRYERMGILKGATEAIQKVVKTVDVTSRNYGENSPVLFDDASRPKGYQWFSPMLTALDEGRVLRFQYQKFRESRSSVRELQPYLLKEYQYRWYIIGKTADNQQFKTFALDRIRDLVITDDYFERVDFSAEKHFQYNFGITMPETDPVEIKLLFNPQQSAYLKTLPLHPTQKIVSDGEEGLLISIFIRPSYEFWEKVLGYGNSVKLLSPPDLVEELKERIRGALALYKG